MANDIETYLRELQAALASEGADSALVQDALFDAEEHLRAETATGADFASVAEGYGNPEEVAAAYMGVAPGQAGAAAVAAPGAGTASEPAAAADAAAPDEGVTGGACPACGSRLGPDQAFCTSCGAQFKPVPGALPAPPVTPEQPLPAGMRYGAQAAAAQAAPHPSVLRQIFGPFVEGRVWTSLLYMLLSLGTGIAYFTIVVTGFSTAGGMIVLIVGIPLFILVLAIVRGLALFEGRMVELMLGTRMPRRSRPTPPNMGFFGRLLFWLKDGRTWASAAYMLLMLPLGVAYFTIAVTGLSLGFGLVTAPIWGWFQWAFGDHVATINGARYDFWPLWAIPIAFVAGLLVLIGFMHLVKWIGRGHAAFAKAMLVRLK